MTIELTAETKELLEAELQTGPFRSIDEPIFEGVHALHRNDAHSFTPAASIKELLHEGHRI